MNSNTVVTVLTYIHDNKLSNYLFTITCWSLWGMGCAPALNLTCNFSPNDMTKHYRSLFLNFCMKPTSGKPLLGSFHFCINFMLRNASWHPYGLSRCAINVIFHQAVTLHVFYNNIEDLDTCNIWVYEKWYRDTDKMWKKTCTVQDVY